MAMVAVRGPTPGHHQPTETIRCLHEVGLSDPPTRYSNNEKKCYWKVFLLTRYEKDARFERNINLIF